MSDIASSGEPTTASAATAGAAPTAATPGNTAPIGSFGTAKGSGLARGKRTTPPAASSASAAPSGYKPSALEVIRPQSEYKNPFTGETSVAAPVVNEPAPQAVPVPSEVIVKEVSAPAPVVAQAAPAPAAPATAAMEGELFPFTLNAATESKPAAPAAKAELKILPTEEVKRPAVSWGETSHSQNGEPRGRRDERATFRPERRDQRPFEPREPRREPTGEPRNQFPRDGERHERPAAPAAEPEKKSGGFFAWLKGLFGGSAATPEVKTGDRQDQGHDGQHRHNRRRHRGGRGRGGFQGDNRGPRDGQPYQPRDPRDEEGPSSHGGEQRYEGGGRHRRRGGRNRNRDDRGGPRSEGQQGGGAI